MDRHDPLAYTQTMFRFCEVKPLAGHSLGPVFLPGLEAIEKIYKLQSDFLHGGHFQRSHPDDEESADWFGCDRYEPALNGEKKLLGFQDKVEFNFTADGLSENLGMILEIFYHLTKKTGIKVELKYVCCGQDFFLIKLSLTQLWGEQFLLQETLTIL